ncbi:MAG TPA: hypothetical protein DCY75_03785, partial [Clostridiales bacterium]|nr:hypothetical protein [Clostridiales bacterium]
YLVDQAIHLVLIAMGAFFFVSWGKTLTMVHVLDRFLIPLTDNPMAIFRWIGAVLFIHKPTNITIKGLLMGSRAQSDMEQNQKQIGAYIGTLERIVILFFFSIDEFSAIGFVLTAKSIARYTEINNHIEFAEYYLMGTLLSAFFMFMGYFIFIL